MILLCLQLFHVLFLGLHDWIPLGRLNNTRAVRAENPGSNLLTATLLSTAPYAVLLYLSARHLHEPYPHGLLVWLAIAYGILFAGELRAWWLPYAFGTDPECTARYRAMFGATHSFLPERHGIEPNTLHVILHVATLATVMAVVIGLAR